jgi:hypothetical protein
VKIDDISRIYYLRAVAAGTEADGAAPAETRAAEQEKHSRWIR